VTSVIIVGSRDRQLEELLTAADMQTKTVDTTALSAFGRSSILPDIVVVDVRSAGIPPALANLKRQRPELGVVIVAAALDPTLMLEAMRAGVSEFVAEPLEQSDLERAVARVLGARPSTEAGRTFGFVGAKGGVGTTTVAVNVAAALSRLERGPRTLVIDMHQAGGDAAVFTGAEPKFSILDAIENTHRLDQTYLSGLVTQIAPGLDLLASSDRTFAALVDPARVRAVLDFVATCYKFTVLDLPRSDAAVLDALDGVSSIFVVANQELATVKSGARMAATLRQRYGRETVKVVLSRSDRQADIGLSDVERAIGVDIAHTFPSDYRLALQALNKGRPLALEGDSDLAASFEKFAAQLAGKKRDDKNKPAVARVGLFGRLTQPKQA